MFHARVRPIALRFFRVAALCLLVVLIAGNPSFTRIASSQVAAQEPTATPSPLAIQPGECTRDLFDNLVQAAIQSWTDTGQISQDMLNSLLYGMTNCYASLDVAGVPTCDQQAAQQQILFVLNSLSTQHSLTSDEYQSLLQVLNTCYGSDLNVDALTIGGAGGDAGSSGGGSGNGAGGGSSDPGGGGQGSGGGPAQPGGPAEEYRGPYHVVKVMDLGGETLDGTVCAINQPFVVSMATPKITFDIQFVPTDKTQGTWTYAYNFADLGETHDASGSYTISVPAGDGTRSLTIDGSDHVVFNGFDGSFPMHYVIGLSPSAEAACGG
jgi:hypothetical protein